MIKKQPKLILICSAKGGVGKSTLCFNLAYGFMKLKHKTAIIDADIYGPSIHHLFNIKAGTQPEIQNNLMIPLEKDNIKFNSMGLIIDGKKALIWRAPMIIKALNNLINNSDWGDSDYIFIDLPPGTGDIHLTMLKNFPTAEAILISTSQKISLIDVERSYDMLNKLNINVLGIIENMSYGDKNYITDFAQENNLNFLGKIPLTNKFLDLDEKQENIFSSNSHKELTKNFIKICKLILKTIKQK